MATGCCKLALRKFTGRRASVQKTKLTSSALRRWTQWLLRSLKTLITSRPRTGLVRRAWWLLAVWAVIWSLPHVGQTAVSWRFFDLGSRTLLAGGPAGGLHVYAIHPALQFGPVALLTAVGFHVFGAGARVAAVLALSGLGLLVLYVIGTTPIGGTCPSRRRQFLAGLVFLPLWTELAVHYAHLDDALALLFALLAVRCVGAQRNVAAGVFLACAADSKPWAVAFLPLLLALPAGRRLRSAFIWAVGVTAAWLPFVIADVRTLRVTAFAIPNTATSALRALGVTSTTTPSWDRPVQIALGCLVAAAAVRTGRWPAAIFAALAVRLLIDPGTYAYYTSGLVLAALLVDLHLTRRHIPLYATSAVLVIYAARALPIDVGTLGTLRAVYCVLAIGSVFLLAPLTRLTTLPGVRKSTDLPAVGARAGDVLRKAS